MNILKIDKCPLCGKQHFDKVHTCVDHYATGESFDLYRCHSCGFMFTQNSPSEDVIGRYYDSPDYISHSDTHKGLMNSVYHRVRQYMLSQKFSIIRKHSSVHKGKLLDIGCGTGYFPHYMKQQGWHVAGIEKSPQARKFAEEHFGLHIQPPEALHGMGEKEYDVVTLWHVMEHLQHLNETWDTLHTILKDYGLLVVAVPNYTSTDAKIYGHMWAAYDVPRHLWHFSPDTMRQFAQKHGFTQEASLPMPFDAFYVSMLTEKYQKKKLTFMRGTLWGAYSWLTTLTNKERSSSVIYIFRKQKIYE